MNTHGESFGTATLDEMEEGVMLHLTAAFLAPGQHGFHIHQGGFCGPPGFVSAEGHFNPDGVMHGFNSENGSRAGDLRNLEVAQNGTVELDRTIAGVYLHPGERSILGKTLIVHARADDYTTQPSGDAGDRIACGVIQPGLAADPQATG